MLTLKNEAGSDHYVFPTGKSRKGKIQEKNIIKLEKLKTEERNDLQKKIVRRNENLNVELN